MFFATFTSTLALAYHIQTDTSGAMGVTEYMVMNAVSGVIYAALGCQPYVVLRPTGPITMLITMLYSISQSIGFDFNSLLATTGLCVGLLMILVAGTELSRFIGHLTRFTCDVFAVFVCSVYIKDGVMGLSGRMSLGVTRGELVGVDLAIVVLVLALWLSTATSGRLFTAPVRRFLSGYALTISIVVVSFFASMDLARSTDFIMLPKEGIAPTNPHREWFVGFGSITGPQQWIASALIAVPITFFFYVDQNISSRLSQVPSARACLRERPHISVHS